MDSYKKGTSQIGISPRSNTKNFMMLNKRLNNTIEYQFSAKLWRNSPENGWYFVTVPSKISKEIRTNLQWQEEGWGRMKTTATIKTLSWDTSIWFDTKINSYVLPVKLEIRKKLSLKEGDVTTIIISI